MSIQIPEWLQKRLRVTQQDFVHLEPVEQPCEDCGEMVLDRRVRHVKSQDQSTAPHYKSHCQICKKYRNPETGAYDCTFQEINSFFRLVKKKMAK